MQCFQMSFQLFWAFKICITIFTLKIVLFMCLFNQNLLLKNFFRFGYKNLNYGSTPIMNILWLILQIPWQWQTCFLFMSFSWRLERLKIKIYFCCNTLVSKLTNFLFSFWSLCCFPWSTSQWRFKSLFFHKSFAP